MSAKTTKKMSAGSAPVDLRPEYRFDYRRARPNRLAAQLPGAVAVVLDPDVAAVFTTSKKVNAALRAVISRPSHVHGARGAPPRRSAG